MTIIRALSWVGASALCSLAFSIFFDSSVGDQFYIHVLWCFISIFLAWGTHTRLIHKRLFWLLAGGFWIANMAGILSYVAQDFDSASGTLREWRGYQGIYHSLLTEWSGDFSLVKMISWLFAIISLSTPITLVLILMRLGQMMLLGRQPHCDPKSPAPPQE
jgi:hypothetical protein